MRTGGAVHMTPGRINQSTAMENRKQKRKKLTVNNQLGFNRRLRNADTDTAGVHVMGRGRVSSIQLQTHNTNHTHHILVYVVNTLSLH